MQLCPWGSAEWHCLNPSYYQEKGMRELWGTRIPFRSFAQGQGFLEDGGCCIGEQRRRVVQGVQGPLAVLTNNDSVLMH